MHKIILVAVFITAVVGVLAEPPVDEPLEGPRHYPELLPRVRDLLIYDNQPGAPGSPSSSAYGPPGSMPGSFGAGGGSGQDAPKQVILADPELAPLLSTFDLSPTVEKRGPAGTAPGSGQFALNGPNNAGPSFFMGGLGGRAGAGGYN